MRALDFLIAGVQKGGTTALWHFLRQHPAIRFGSRKELHVFDDESLDWESIDWRQPPYEQLHRQYGPTDGHLVCGDATPIYTYWPPSMARIHAYNPRIKLIILFRHPAERAFSHWRMERQRGAETLSFADAIRHGRERVTGATAFPPGHHRVFSYVERGFYDTQLDRVFAHFDPSQVLLLRQCDLDRQHVATLDRVCDFLRIERFPRPPDREQVFSHAPAGAQAQAGATGISAADAAVLAKLYAASLVRLGRDYNLDLRDPADGQ